MGAHWQASEKLGEQTMDVVESLEETCQQEDIFWQELKGAHEGDFAFDDEDVFLAELNVDYWKNYFVFNKGLVKRKAFGFGCFSIRNSVLSKNIFEALVGFEYKQPTTSDIVIEEEIKVISKYPLPDPYMFEGNGQSVESHDLIEKECQERAKKLEEKLRHFGVEGNVTSVKPGPIITLFEYTPAMGTKISKINFS